LTFTIYQFIQTQFAFDNGSYSAQTTAFFEDADQMGLAHARVKLQDERVTTVGDPAEFEKESIKQVVDNLRNHGERILDPNP
jgi:hypothetical protein